MRILLTTLHSKYIHASLALPLLAAYCRDLGAELCIREFTVHEPREQILGALLAEAPDAIAFSVAIWNRRQTLELADMLVAVRPDLRIVVGGPEVSFDGPELLARHSALHALVRGEGEEPLRGLLVAWLQNRAPEQVPRLTWRDGETIRENPDGPVLAVLDRIPSPFELGLVDLTRGFVYLETSRGCPYRCAFCMSALETTVRSYSMERIRRDLDLLMGQGVSRIKLVDRTFNYDPDRARQIFEHILRHNRGSHFHFEIGGHLLDEKTLQLLTEVPPATFRFEIGVQSTLPDTLRAIHRPAALDLLEKNVRQLRKMSAIELHLDLIAGLPGEGFGECLRSIDRVAALRPHHLQLEPVKLLPGSPLRRDAARYGIRFDPHPPYGALVTNHLSFAELERLRGIGRLLDLVYNEQRGQPFLEALSSICGSLGEGLERLEAFWRAQDLFRRPLAQRELFERLWEFSRCHFSTAQQQHLGESLAWGLATSERIAQDKAPDFFTTDLAAEEKQRVRERLQRVQATLKGRGFKVQHLAARFHHRPDLPEAGVVLFLYLTRPGSPMLIRHSLL